jgi:hypothetical protein
MNASVKLDTFALVVSRNACGSCQPPSTYLHPTMSIPLGPTTTVTIARWTSQVLGVAAIAQLVQGVTAPGALAGMFGLPLSTEALAQKRSGSASSSARHPASLGASSDAQAARREKQWITVYTSRNAILGLLILTFGYGQNNWKAVGTVFRCTILAGVTDMIVAGLQEGQMGIWAFHAAGTAVVATLGYILG